MSYQIGSLSSEPGALFKIFCAETYFCPSHASLDGIGKTSVTQNLPGKNRVKLKEPVRGFFDILVNDMYFFVQGR